MAEIEVRKNGTVATLILNRPERKNATTPTMWPLLGEYLAEFEHDAAVRAVILTGAGGNFCSGADVGGTFPKTVPQMRERLANAQEVILKLHNLSKPTIAMVRGHAVGAGLSLAMACDFIHAADNAKFSYIFTRRGLAGDAGALVLLTQRVGLVRAKELIYSGRMVAAAEALQIGLCQRVLSDAELDSAVDAAAAELADGPTFAIGTSKRLLHKVWTSLAEYLPAEQNAALLVGSSEDATEGIAAIREKRAPKFSGN